eukprot:gene41182-50977_t
MHRNDLTSCHDCGLLHRRHPLGPREKARCVRCGSVLYRGSPPDLDRIAAITLCAIIVFLIAQFFPIVELDVSGYTTSATLLGAIRVLWQEQMQVVAVNVLLFTIVFPAIELGALLYVTLALRAGYQPPGFHRLLRAVRKARQWGMTEVLMIGILITIIKMTSLAQVVAQPGLFAFGALVTQSVQQLADQGAALDQNLAGVRSALMKDVVTKAANAPGDNRLAQAQQLQAIVADTAQLAGVKHGARL